MMILRTLCSRRFSSCNLPSALAITRGFNLLKRPPQCPKGIMEHVITRMMTGLASSDFNNNAAGLLAAKDDEYGGVTVELNEAMEMDCQFFASSLKSSLTHWRKQGKKGVWIKLGIEHADLIQAAVKEGFEYHHAEPRYVMLTKWIPVDEPSTLPANASHRISIGAFVINHNKQVLVVQEKKGMLRGMGVWKFPTGMINQGEDICTAAVREVKEETGIDTRFVQVLTFRESHQAFFQKSDILFVCLLEPLSFNIQEQESEIEAAQWMDFEEYASQCFVQRYEVLKQTTRICRAVMEGRYNGFQTEPIKPSTRDGRDFIYFNNTKFIR